MGRGRKRVLTFFISYMICLMFLLYHMHGIDESDPAFVLDIQPHYSRSESANKLRRKLVGGVPKLLRMEIARRKLSRDEQELWYFLAAQLNLHSGHFISHLPTIPDVIAALKDYQGVLNDDIASFKSAIASDPGAPQEEMLSILQHFNNNITRLFNLTFTVLSADFQASEKVQASAILDEDKLNIRFKHIILHALLQQIFSYTDREGNFKTESQYLGDKIHQNIIALQNPSDCQAARKLLCGVCRDLGDCGFACFIHHIAHCLVTAYLSNRTMIMDCEGWKYSVKGPEVAFLPLSNCSLKHVGPVKKDFNGTNDLHWLMDQSVESIVMHMPFRFSNPAPEIWAPMVPKDLLYRVLKFNSHPPAWWIGQFKVWAVRLKEDVAKEVKMHIDLLDIKDTIVGIQVRRTDKTREAAHHPLHEYMVHVDEWYDAYGYLHPGTRRRVYLATDDSSLINEAERLYPRYEFIHDKNISISAAINTRYNELSLRGIIKDIYSLLQCNYIVCTLSSTVCRLVYELMQTKHGDAHSFQSLDDIYYVAGQDIQHGRVIKAHNQTRPNELNVREGDILKIYGNHWDGYVLGSFLKGQSGLVPAFKIENIVKSHNYSSRIRA